MKAKQHKLQDLNKALDQIEIFVGSKKYMILHHPPYDLQEVRAIIRKLSENEFFRLKLQDPLYQDKEFIQDWTDAQNIIKAIYDKLKLLLATLEDSNEL